MVLTEKPGEWAFWQIAPLPLALAAVAGLAWTAAAGSPAWGWAAALGLLAFVLADWGLLALLPRRGISFGAVQPPLLALSLVRWLLVLLAIPFAGRWPLAALIVLALVQLLISILAIYGTMIEPFRVQVTHLDIASARLPKPSPPLRIVHLSDLHVERLTRRERALPSLVAELDPDLIVITGDLLSTSYNSDARATADLEALLAQLHAPAGIYAVWGTAEVDFPEVLRPVLDRLGIVVLEDRAIQVRAGDRSLWLMGLSCTRDLDADDAKLGALLSGAPQDAPTLLLYHTPDLMPQAAARDVDLYLAGHTHGGQWCLPGFGAILTSSQHWKRYESGHYDQDGTHLYVSRGLGMEGFGTPRARFFCPPEVVLIALSARDPEG